MDPSTKPNKQKIYVELDGPVGFTTSSVNSRSGQKQEKDDRKSEKRLETPSWSNSTENHESPKDSARSNPGGYKNTTATEFRTKYRGNCT